MKCANAQKEIYAIFNAKSNRPHHHDGQKDRLCARQRGKIAVRHAQNLSVKNLDVESGKLQIEGRVDAIKYVTKTTPSSIAKRIFK